MNHWAEHVTKLGGLTILGRGDGRCLGFRLSLGCFSLPLLFSVRSIFCEDQSNRQRTSHKAKSEHRKERTPPRPAGLRQGPEGYTRFS